jgi:opacity protein-like surface antigen
LGVVVAAAATAVAADAAEPPPPADPSDTAGEKVSPTAEPPRGGAPAPAPEEDDDVEDDFEDDFDDEGTKRVEDDEPEPGPPPPVTGPARPGPLPEIETPAAPEWRRHAEVGGGVVYVSRPLLHEVPPRTPRYQAGVGFGVDLRWELLSFLRIHPYFLHVIHDVSIPPGALTTDGTNSISSATEFPETQAASFSFGAQVEPTWQFNDRLRAWLAAGIGWGRLRIPVQTASDPTAGDLFLRDRAFSFVEFPMGMGAGFDVIERWLAVSYDMAVVPVIGQTGNALESFQGLDAAGQVRDIGPLEPFHVYFAHSLNLALIL